MADEWSWMYPGDETAHGPYGSRAEAIVEARQNYGDGDGIGVLVGKISYPDPAYFAASIADANEVLENMDEALGDGVGEFFTDGDEMFEALPGADDALKKALAKWARKYVKRIGAFTLKEANTKRVEIGPRT